MKKPKKNLDKRSRLRHPRKGKRPNPASKTTLLPPGIGLFGDPIFMHHVASAILRSLEIYEFQMPNIAPEGVFVDAEFPDEIPCPDCNGIDYSTGATACPTCMGTRRITPPKS